MTLYIDTLNKYIFKRIPSVFIAAPSFVFFILDFILPIRLANRIVPAMQIYMYSVIVLDSILFIISVFKSRDFISTISIISLAVVALGATCDILLIHHVSFMNGVHLLMPAFVQFAFLQIVLLAYIQNKNYMKVFELNDYLHETNQAYYRFVPREFLELLCKKDVTEITLGEYKISKAAVLSADIRNFTSTSEKLVPIQVFDMLNSYLRRVAPLIRKYHGVIEKYLGDGIIAIFPDSAESALNCAIEMQEQMIELREEFSSRGMPQIQIGIGVHYGDIVIGTGGNNDRMTEISLSKDIDILQNQNDIKNKEVNDMINSNKDLKKSLDDYNGRFDETNQKYRDNKEQKEMMKKIYDESKNEIMKRKKENEKLHGLMYGRFFENKKPI
jgi:hypothetical protein